jgi:hypothetical protein
MNKFIYSAGNLNALDKNPQHNFAKNHALLVYNRDALFTFIPKNACSSVRLSIAIDNGCIDTVEQGHWIHANNRTFNPTNKEAACVKNTFVILRCPFKRLASVYLDKMVSKEPDAWAYRKLMGRGMNLDDLTFRDFVMSLKNSSIFKSNIHWRKQVDFLLFYTYTKYFNVENLASAFLEIDSIIGLTMQDARPLTNHGTDLYQKAEDKNYCDTAAFDIAKMKREGVCPSHESLYDKEIYSVVEQLYKDDINLYTDKFSSSDLMKI